MRFYAIRSMFARKVTARERFNQEILHELRLIRKSEESLKKRLKETQDELAQTRAQQGNQAHIIANYQQYFARRASLVTPSAVPIRK